MRELTKGEIRKQALTILRLRGCKMWIQNNIAVRGRAFIGEPGQSDLIGYIKNTGIMVACEIKTKTDRLSIEQKIFLDELQHAGGISLIATDVNGMVELREHVNPTSSTIRREAEILIHQMKNAP